MLCYNIKEVEGRTPEFIVNVFEFVYARDVIGEWGITLGKSLILPLRSNAQRDYESARCSLGKYFSHLLERYPSLAIDATVCTISGYVIRRHPLDTPMIHTPIPGHGTYLKADCSYI